MSVAFINKGGNCIYFSGIWTGTTSELSQQSYMILVKIGLHFGLPGPEVSLACVRVFFFLVLKDFWDEKVLVHFVEIGEIADHHSLNVLFITKLHNCQQICKLTNYKWEQNLNYILSNLLSCSYS